MPKQTSEEISSLAGRYIDYYASDLMSDFGKACTTGFPERPAEFLRSLTKDIRSLAASCLSQDETSSAPIDDEPIDDETVMYSPDELADEDKGEE